MKDLSQFYRLAKIVDMCGRKVMLISIDQADILPFFNFKKDTCDDCGKVAQFVVIEQPETEGIDGFVVPYFIKVWLWCGGCEIGG